MSSVHSPSAHTQPGAAEGGSSLPAPGQWAVLKSWRYDVAEITKVSTKQVRTRRHGEREAYHHPTEILFAGSEKAARDLASALSSLAAQHGAERRQMADQHRAALARAIDTARKATTAASPELGGDDRAAGVNQ